MKGYNRVIIAGHVGSIKISGDVNKVCNMSIATNESYKSKDTGEKVDKTTWHDIVIFGQTAEFCEKYVTKGMFVLVEGKLQKSKYKTQDGLEVERTKVNAQLLQIMERKNSDGQEQPQHKPSPEQQMEYERQYRNKDVKQDKPKPVDDFESDDYIPF